MSNYNEAINTLIRNRRSIKPESFSEQVVPENILIQILENANWAPTHGHTEPWRFIIFSGDARRKLGNFEANYYKNKTSEAQFVQKKYDKALNRPERATYVLALCMKRQTEGKKIMPEIEEVAAVSCAVQNMWLTAQAYGVAAYWGSGGATYSDEMKVFLDLAPQDKCLGFFYLGYSDQQPQGKRNSGIQDKIQWVNTNYEL